MNITKQQLDDLNAVVKIELQPADYQDRVSQVIRQYQKTASVPGFRPGKVPAGIIKKMYGKAVLVDELNKLLSDSHSYNKCSVVLCPDLHFLLQNPVCYEPVNRLRSCH